MGVAKDESMGSTATASRCICATKEVRPKGSNSRTTLADCKKIFQKYHPTKIIRAMVALQRIILKRG